MGQALGLVGYSHLAASAEAAVMIGSDATGEAVEAWYSEARGG